MLLIASITIDLDVIRSQKSVGIAKLSLYQ